MNVELTFSASIKLSSQAYMTFPGFHANLYKSCNDGWIDYVANGFIPVQIVPDECLMSEIIKKIIYHLSYSIPTQDTFEITEFKHDVYSNGKGQNLILSLPTFPIMVKSVQ